MGIIFADFMAKQGVERSSDMLAFTVQWVVFRTFFFFSLYNSFIPVGLLLLLESFIFLIKVDKKKPLKLKMKIEYPKMSIK